MANHGHGYLAGTERLYGGGTPVATDAAELALVGDGAVVDKDSVQSGMSRTMTAGLHAAWFWDTDHPVPAWISQVPAADREIYRVTFIGRGDNPALIERAVAAVITDNGGGSFTRGAMSTFAGGPTVAAPWTTGVYNLVDAILDTPLAVAAGQYLAIGLDTTDAASGNVYAAGRAATGKTISRVAVDSLDTAAISSVTETADYALCAIFWIRTTAKKIVLTPGSEITYGTQLQAPCYRDVPYYIALDTIATAADEKITLALAGLQTYAVGGDHGKLTESAKLELDLAAADETAAYPWPGTEAALSSYTDGDGFNALIYLGANHKASRAFIVNTTDGDAGGSSDLDITLQSVNNLIAGDGTRGNEQTQWRKNAGGLYNDGTVDEKRYLTQLTVTQDAGSPTVGTVVICRKPWIGGASSWSTANPYALTHVGHELDDNALGYFTAQPYVMAYGISGGHLRTATQAGSTLNGFLRRAGLGRAGLFGETADSVAGTHDLIDLVGAVIWLPGAGLVNDTNRSGNGPGSDYLTNAVPMALGALAVISATFTAGGNEVIMTDVPSTLDSSGDPVDYLDAAVTATNAALPYLCQAHGAVMVRCFDAICAYDNAKTAYRIREALQYDAATYIHMNAAGDRLVAKAMADAYEGRI